MRQPATTSTTDAAISPGGAFRCMTACSGGRQVVSDELTHAGLF